MSIKKAVPATIVIERANDMPVPTASDLVNLLMHRNFEVTNVVDVESENPIITILEVAKDALSA